MTRRALALVALSLALGATARGGDDPIWHDLSVRRGSFTLVTENDKYFAGTDRHYTNGFKLLWLGETTLDVHCRCLAGENPLAELDLQRGAGKATLLPAHRFAVYGTRGSKQGKSSRDILGYRFQSGKSVAAIDVTKASGAYYADNLSPEEQKALTCLYAGILLHRAKR